MSKFPLSEFLKNARLLEKRVALALAEAALNPSQYRLLSEFASQNSLTASELSRRLHVSKPTVTHLLAQLQTMSVIDSRTDPVDQRSKQFMLTKHGKMRLKIANEMIAVLERRLASTCTEKQLQALQQLKIEASKPT